jgi:hypothetical protein
VARATVSIGAAPNDGTGDTIRVGGGKINDNFAELYAALGGDSLPGIPSGSLAPLDATPDTDHTANGPKTATLNAGATVTVMDLCYLASDGEWALTDADAAATAGGMLAISLESKTDGQAMSVALPGAFVRDDTWAWTPGATLYVSTTPGAITATQPSGTDDVVRVVGFAVTADVIYFAPSADYATVV